MTVSLFLIFVDKNLCLGRNNRYVRFIVAFLYERNCAIYKGEQGVVFAQTYVVTRMVQSSSLADDDVARNSGLAAENLNAQSLTC